MEYILIKTDLENDKSYELHEKKINDIIEQNDPGLVEIFHQNIIQIEDMVPQIITTMVVHLIDMENINTRLN